MNENLKKLLILEIHKGKNLNNLDENYIENKLEKYLLREGSKRKKIEEIYNNLNLEKNKIEKNKIFKEIIKEVRSQIGQVYGQFLTTNFKKREKYLDKYETKEDIKEILKLHKSTRERFNFYNEVYEKIFNWYKPKVISDLCCGLNPISYVIIKEKLNYSPKYFASDLGFEDMNFLNYFFKKFEIDANAKSYDISNLEILKNENLQNSDLVFLFKALDSLEEIKKNISKELLDKINSKHIIVSFPTKSLVSKKNIKISKRDWLINFVKKQNWDLEQFQIENEIFFMINKK